MANSINGMAERLREFLIKPGIIELPGCFDVLSAMLLEQVGFKSVFLSGYGVAASNFGNPDIGLTTLTETAIVTKNMANALRIPVVVDVDNGYGNEDNVIRMVYELESAGAAGMVMEDQVFPKRCGHSNNKKVVPLNQYMAKLEVALKTRQTPMVIVARTDVVDVDEAIARAQAFHAAGADVTLIDGLRSLEAAERIANEVPGLKQINLIYGGKTPLLSAPELEKMGFKIVLYSTPALYVATQAMLVSMKKLKDSRDLNSISAESYKFQDFQSLLEQRYIERPYAHEAHLENIRKGQPTSVDSVNL